jgi:hypothetical protein
MREQILNQIKSAFGDFNSLLSNVVHDLTVSPEVFNPHIWNLVTNIYYIMLGIGYVMLSLFFIMDFLNKSTRLEFIRWENVIKPLLKLILAKFILENSFRLLNLIFTFMVGVIQQTAVLGKIAIPEHQLAHVEKAIEGMNLFEQIIFSVNMMPWVLIMNIIKIVVFLIIYLRMIEIYMYTAISPMPLATMSSDGLHHIAKSFLQKYIAICLQGLIILIGVMIYGGLIKGLSSNIDPNDLCGIVRNTVLTSSVLMLILIKSGSCAKQITGLGG